MRKIYLEGPLGQKFGEEWNLNVNSPSEALTAIMAQRPGMRQFITESEGIQGYEVLIDNEPVEMLEELVISAPGATHQSYTFVPVIAGSKSSIMTMILGVTLIAITGGMAAGMVPGFMGQMGTVATSGAITGASGAVGGAQLVGAGMTYANAAAAAGTTMAKIMATQGLGLLGMGLLLGGAAMMLTPDTPDQESAEQAENYLFGGPVNTVKQGEPIPLVYGRAIVGSKTISASIFTETSREKLSKNRNMVGIDDFREPGSKTRNDMAYGGSSTGGQRGRGGIFGPIFDQY